ALSFRGITTLDRAPAQNQNALAVTRTTARTYGLTRVSDLIPVAPRLSFGGPPECPERRFCLPGLMASYGLTFRTFLPLDAAGPLTVGALEGAEVDVALLFTTSPVVAVKDLLLLADDRQLQPAENVVPVVRNDVLARYGDRMRQAVNAVSAALTTDELVQLNKAVDLDGLGPVEVARAWLGARGLGRA
ncbi:MAG: hypothetical protein LC733_00750, partial [Actinobacteria bacterium]|nr:hypothetical protein [Actinomycetota bacterium]